MWHFSGITMDFSCEKYHFRNRKHTLFRQKTMLFSPENIFSADSKHTIGHLKTYHRTPLEGLLIHLKGSSSPYSSSILLFSSKASVSKKANQIYFCRLSALFYNTLLRVKTMSIQRSLLTFPSHDLLFSEKIRILDERKTAYGPT